MHSLWCLSYSLNANVFDKSHPREDILLEWYKDWHSFECPSIPAPANKFVRTETAARKESETWFIEDYFTVALR